MVKNYKTGTRGGGTNKMKLDSSKDVALELPKTN